jgi:hypothetical protein
MEYVGMNCFLTLKLHSLLPIIVIQTMEVGGGFSMCEWVDI